MPEPARIVNPSSEPRKPAALKEKKKEKKKKKKKSTAPFGKKNKNSPRSTPFAACPKTCRVSRALPGLWPLPHPPRPRNRRRRSPRLVGPACPPRGPTDDGLFLVPYLDGLVPPTTCRAALGSVAAFPWPAGLSSLASPGGRNPTSSRGLPVRRPRVPSERLRRTNGLPVRGFVADSGAGGPAVTSKNGEGVSGTSPAPVLGRPAAPSFEGRGAARFSRPLRASSTGCPQPVLFPAKPPSGRSSAAGPASHRLSIDSLEPISRRSDSAALPSSQISAPAVPVRPRRGTPPFLARQQHTQKPTTRRRPA